MRCNVFAFGLNTALLEMRNSTAPSVTLCTSTVLCTNSRAVLDTEEEMKTRKIFMNNSVPWKVQLLTLLVAVAVSLAQNTRGGGGFVGVIAGGFGGGGGGGGGCGGGGCGGGFGGGGGYGGGFGGSSGGCRYWCRTNIGQYYCCEGGGNNINYPVVKPGRCPPVRPQCPPVRTFRPPSTCSSDSSCAGSDKCCYDTCLRHHTCKPPNFYG
ncbi:heterogeneous nuclear ribonucleoprotein A3 homolog 2-like [Penaeus chinensis]|uniref:heterogeneous nuclear ribonucleoprotein A3 homolog 2-like n=1 Tax=Penaeus chinensis TaxID=139456 RepID=UPI001FB59F3E|nr:heterogeneous nuclear ribonucleoprotein A3 homolog 2-like [Penaeus chinensis]